MVLPFTLLLMFNYSVLGKGKAVYFCLPAVHVPRINGVSLIPICVVNMCTIENICVFLKNKYLHLNGFFVS